MYMTKQELLKLKDEYVNTNYTLNDFKSGLGPRDFYGLKYKLLDKIEKIIQNKS